MGKVARAAVFGLGQFGASVAARLYAEGVEVLAVDRSLRLVEAIKDRVSAAAAFDATVRENLLEYAVGEMDVAVVATGTHFEATVMVTVLCRELGVPLVVAKALTDMQKRVLLTVGAQQVVLPEEEMGHRLAEHLLRESVVDFVQLPDGFSLHRLDVPEAWVGRSLAELALLSGERLNLIQIVRRAAPGGAEPELIPLPHGAMQLQEGDRVDVIGPDDVLRRYL